MNFFRHSVKNLLRGSLAYIFSGLLTWVQSVFVDKMCLRNEISYTPRENKGFGNRLLPG